MAVEGAATSKSRSTQLGAICMTNVRVQPSNQATKSMLKCPYMPVCVCVCVRVKRLAAELQKFYKSWGILWLGKSFCVCFQLNAFE